MGAPLALPDAPPMIPHRTLRGANDVLNTITLDTAQAQTWDVIIAGSSFAAMFFLRGLPDDLRVLIVEKGPLHSLEDDLIHGTDRDLEDFAISAPVGDRKTWVAHTKFGGNSTCWWGQVPRFHPSDFRLSELHQPSAPWPITYDDIEPAYAEIEAIMEVAGADNGHILHRSTPFPFPAHALTRAGAAAVAARPDIWVPVPTARSNGGNRATCCANGVCHLCPIDAKYTILNGISAFERPGVALLMDTELHQVDITNQRATGVVLRDSAGQTHRLATDLVALGTNAIFNAAIMLRSGMTDAALGRYLHEQTSRLLFLDIAQPNYFGGTSITEHCYGYYDGPHRATSGAVLVENYNVPSALRAERDRWTHRMRLKLIAEDLPQADCVEKLRFRA
ncbi:MAG: hypothetical protein GKR99_03760 [Rhodobacteraceae bacterium]|nr:hypothetical protein [Paracoccaceae bacterium]